MKVIRKKLIRNSLFGTLFSFFVFSMGCLLFITGLTDSPVYGFSLFVILPLSLGFSLGSLLSKQAAFNGSVFGFLLSISLLLLGGLEGFICVAMAAPIVFVALIIGILIAHIRYKADKRNGLLITTLPLLVIMIGATVETKSKSELVWVHTTEFISANPIDVFNSIKSVDTISQKPPILMSLGLPQPMHCVLEDEVVGATRVCVFENGFIEEEVVEIEPGEILSMKVTDYNLIGRSWLHFEDALYKFQDVDSGTLVIRSTSYNSELKPRFYWEPLEKWMMNVEHRYVLDDLKNKYE